MLKKDRVYVIAEIGGNFFTFKEAKRLVDAAKEAGVDCIKLQTFRADTIVSKSAMFDMENTGKISQYEYFRKFEVSEELHKEVFDYIDSKEMDWLSTPSHETDLEMLVKLGMKAVKVGADDAWNIPFLRSVAKSGLQVFLSTGMCLMDEVKESVKTLEDNGAKKLVIFHTVSNYPTHPEDVNLNVIKTFIKEFPEYVIGFSDHTISTTASIAAAAIGARVIERHFTLDKNAEGPDHILSSTPEEMKYLVDCIRDIEKMKGTGEKQPFGDEVQNRHNNRKSITAIKPIKKGEALTTENIGIRRPGHGIEPKYMDEIIGKVARKNLASDTTISWEEVEQ